MFRGGGGARTVGVRPSVSYNPRMIGHGAHRPQGGKTRRTGGPSGGPPPSGSAAAASMPHRIRALRGAAPWPGAPVGPASAASPVHRSRLRLAALRIGSGGPSVVRSRLPSWSARRFQAAASCRRTATQKPGAGPGSGRGCAWCRRRANVVQGMNDLILPQDSGARHPRAAPPRPAGRPRGQSAGKAAAPSRTAAPPAAPRGTETAR